jgi:hypothetical protein
VLRDTLHRHGIPAGWFDAEVLVSTSRTGERGIHWRLVVKNADPRLLTYAVSLQHALVKRLTTFDPLASGWLTGISWQYALPAGSSHPALPHPGTWKEPVAEDLAELKAEPAGGASDVIAGPTTHERAAQRTRNAVHARADLDGIFAARDADFSGHGRTDDATQPMFLGTEPAKL